LMFDRNSVLNATICASGSPAFTVTTSKSMTRTDICDVPGQCIISTIKRREVFSDTVKFPKRNGGSSVAINKWLRSITMPTHTEPCTSLVTDDGNFVWKTDPTYRLALFPEEDASVPIAYMTRVRPPEPLVLVFKAGSEDMVEDILVSFIILEQRLRMKEKLI
ncbi:hypothetical protein B0H34DRAFT_628134, partial [Crassisporium funariophilum]